MSSADLFEFWSEMPADEYIHPRDKLILGNLPIESFLTSSTLPAAFDGPIQTAKIVLLYLNPGFSEQDEVDASSIEGRMRYQERRSGFGQLSNRRDHPSAHAWWQSRLKPFGNADDLAPHAAILNICCYHSLRFVDWPMLAALPSSRATLDYAQFSLFPEAIAGKRVVVCLRSHRYWGLPQSGRFGEALFALRTGRGGHALRGQEALICAIREKVTGLVYGKQCGAQQG